VRTTAYALALVVVIADRVSTATAESHLHGIEHVWGPFGFALTFNSGFAFSLFSGRAVVISVVLCVAVACLGVAVAFVRTLPQALGAGLILGGAVGNLSERLFGGHQGQVPDFITLTHWPTFNVADACITVGAITLAASLLFGRPLRTEG